MGVRDGPIVEVHVKVVVGCYVGDGEGLGLGDRASSGLEAQIVEAIDCSVEDGEAPWCGRWGLPGIRRQSKRGYCLMCGPWGWPRCWRRRWSGSWGLSLGFGLDLVRALGLVRELSAKSERMLATSWTLGKGLVLSLEMVRKKAPRSKRLLDICGR